MLLGWKIWFLIANVTTIPTRNISGLRIALGILDHSLGPSLLGYSRFLYISQCGVTAHIRNTQRHTGVKGEEIKGMVTTMNGLHQG